MGRSLVKVLMLYDTLVGTAPTEISSFLKQAFASRRDESMLICEKKVKLKKKLIFFVPLLNRTIDYQKPTPQTPLFVSAYTTLTEKLNWNKLLHDCLTMESGSAADRNRTFCGKCKQLGSDLEVFLCGTAIGDETWLYQNSSEDRAQSK